MTQRHIPHQVTLPPCAAGHASRHVHDSRRREAGGGHVIECACRYTAKHPAIELAIDEWFHLNHRRRARTPRAPVAVVPAEHAAAILQFPLSLVGGLRHG